MESDAHETMAELERAEAAPYIDYRPTPWWVAPYFGLYFVGLVLAFAWTSDAYRPVYFAILAVLLVSLFVVVRHIKRRNGALPFPGRGTPPPEIARVYRLYFWSLIPVAAVLLLSFFLLPVPVSAVIAFVTVTAGVVLYDRVYERAAVVVRERLA